MNVTIDPLEKATCVENPEIEDVLELASGTLFSVRSLIGSLRYEEAVRERAKIRVNLKKSPKYHCALCSTPVTLICNTKKRFFFRHLHEDGSCPAETRGALTREQIQARKYHGLRESEPHKRIKRLLLQSLLADPKFGEIEVERRLKSGSDPRVFRQPDVRAFHASGPVVFEAQLSTTFLDVVVGRTDFYRDEGVLLIWVMASFEPDYRRMTTDDILFNNNSNILTIDDETVAKSIQSSAFHVRCHFRRPKRAGTQLQDEWDAAVVPFDQLTLDREKQRAWWFNYEGKANEIRAEIEQQANDARRREDEELRKGFTDFWRRFNRNERATEDDNRAWAHLIEQFEARGIELAPSATDDSSLVALLNGLLSAEDGKPVGWQYEKLIQVGHRIVDAYPEHILAFGFACNFFERQKLLAEQDRSRKWEERRGEIIEATEDGALGYCPDTNSIALVTFLYPEVGRNLQRCLKRYWPSRFY